MDANKGLAKFIDQQGSMPDYIFVNDLFKIRLLYIKTQKIYTWNTSSNVDNLTEVNDMNQLSKLELEFIPEARELLKASPVVSSISDPGAKAADGVDVKTEKKPAEYDILSAELKLEGERMQADEKRQAEYDAKQKAEQERIRAEQIASQAKSRAEQKAYEEKRLAEELAEKKADKEKRVAEALAEQEEKEKNEQKAAQLEASFKKRLHDDPQYFFDRIVKEQYNIWKGELIKAEMCSGNILQVVDSKRILSVSASGTVSTLILPDTDGLVDDQKIFYQFAIKTGTYKYESPLGVKTVSEYRILPPARYEDFIKIWNNKRIDVDGIITSNWAWLGYNIKE